MDLSYVSFLLFVSVGVTILLWGSPASATGSANETDKLALLAFKLKIIQDPLGTLFSWNDSLHFCEWKGVTCGRRHRRVTTLDLHSKGLVGSISPHIGNLSFLKVIDLANNKISGEIPQEIGHLFRLQMIFLTNNSLEGEIPSNFSGCSDLKVIYLLNNMLVGKIPVELGFLLKLIRFNFGMNYLTGEIPNFLGNLSSLQFMAFAHNSFEGSIPDSLSQLRSLQSLLLGQNMLSGKVPSSIFNLSSLMFISLELNKLQGNLPPDLGFTLPNLQEFYASENQFTGPIPVSISNASNLVSFEIAINKFSGKVSIDWGSLKGLSWLNLALNNLGSGEINDLNFITSLVNCTHLEILALNDNNFGGELPNSISNLSSKLTSFIIGGNQVFGSIPKGIGNLASLSLLGMQVNLLMGSIPTSMGKLQNLEVLTLARNKLWGEIPSSMGNLTQLTKLYLHVNNFSGSIPPSLGNCKSLLLLVLFENNLGGMIPQEILGLSSLSISLSLARNNLIGSLSSEVANLSNLAEFDISENKLSGEIPNSFEHCRDMVYLYMQGNSFIGTIPSSFIRLTALEVLDLSRNNLSGEIPKFLGKFSLLRSLNLSFNDFEGEVPIERVFSNESAFSIIGNTKLCGGITKLQLPVCNVQEPKDKKGGTSPTTKLVVAICTGTSCLILALLFLILYQRRKGKKGVPPKSSTGEKFLKISYQDLLKMTNGFSTANLIGVGGFGSVFKGILDWDGSVVAVKVLNLEQRGASKSFTAECEAFKNMRHRNLVKIITSCSSNDFRGNDFKAIVYEFMANGSLERWLHEEDDENSEIQTLNFLQRLNIAIDVATAMEYLHHHCHKPIIHCDLKPSNVLLDNDMIAHVSDYGLARFLVEVTNKRSQSQTSSSAIKGTIGYAAPEYGMGSEVSTQGDVYSYGIMLLEIFTRKKPTNDIFKDGLNLHKLAEMALPERVMEIVDPTLLLVEEEGEEAEGMRTIQNTSCISRLERMEECLISIVRIGVTCSTESPRERMSMCDVSRELHMIKKSFFNVSQISGAR